MAFYKNDNSENNYYLFVQEGDSNYWDSDGRLVKNWYLIAKGHQYQIIQKVCYRAGFCEGGLLQKARSFNGGVWIKPETYIALHREAIKNAKPLEKITNFFRITCVIKLLKGEYESKYQAMLTGHDKYVKRELLDVIKQHDDLYQYNDNEFDVYEKYVKTPDDFDYFASLPESEHYYYVKFKVFDNSYF
jgi:hypothetical protein